jgi:hypothetical protein
MKTELENLIKQIIDGSGEYEDGELGAHRCFKLYCEDHGISDDIMELAYARWERDEALAAGIPLSVIEGKTKLTDHFSKDYIAWQCGKNPTSGES